MKSIAALLIFMFANAISANSTLWLTVGVVRTNSIKNDPNPVVLTFVYGKEYRTAYPRTPGVYGTGVVISGDTFRSKLDAVKKVVPAWSVIRIMDASVISDSTSGTVTRTLNVTSYDFNTFRMEEVFAEVEPFEKEKSFLIRKPSVAGNGAFIFPDYVYIAYQ